MAGRVNNVDAHIFPDDGRGLRQNRDAALFFQLVGIHDALDDALIVAERAGLLQELVHQSGFAMVNVRDDRDIAEFHKFTRDMGAGSKAGAVSVARAYTGEMAEGEGGVSSAISSASVAVSVFPKFPAM